MTIVCGDSHTSTHGAFGALAHGIGTSEVEHVLATQTLIQNKAKNMLVQVDGQLPPGVTAKDIILSIIGEIGTAGGTGYVIEYAGEAIRALSMEGRMTVCNMSIEGGARAGLIAPDETTFAYVKDKPRAPKGEAWEKALAYWQTLRSDEGAHFDRVVKLDAANLPPIVTWGSSPEDVVAVTGAVPDPDTIADENKRSSKKRALDYMGLKPGTKITDITLDRVFIGSCTNGRIEDLRAVAKVVEGKKVAASVDAMIVPGSGLVKEQAEAEGLDKIFIAAGFDWREPGCSMCLAMNEDRLKPQRTLRLDVEPQFRGTAGVQGPHPSRLAGHGGGGGDCRAFRRYQGMEINQPQDRGLNPRSPRAAFRVPATPLPWPKGRCAPCRAWRLSRRRFSDRGGRGRDRQASPRPCRSRRTPAPCAWAGSPRRISACRRAFSPATPQRVSMRKPAWLRLPNV